MNQLEEFEKTIKKLKQETDDINKVSAVYAEVAGAGKQIASLKTELEASAKKSSQANQAMTDSFAKIDSTLSKRLDELKAKNETAIADINTMLTERLDELKRENETSLGNVYEKLTQKFNELKTENETFCANIDAKLSKRLDELETDNKTLYSNMNTIIRDGMDDMKSDNIHHYSDMSELLRTRLEDQKADVKAGISEIERKILAEEEKTKVLFEDVRAKAKMNTMFSIANMVFIAAVLVLLALLLAGVAK
jgi:uncharacterized protein YicC (UPF0701 family)